MHSRSLQFEIPNFNYILCTIFLDETGDHLEMLMRNSATGVVPLQNSTPKRLTEVCVTDGIVRSISYTYYL
jgi:hypothetical protein